MSNENITYLTDAVLITVVAPLGRVDDMVKAALDVGATGVIAHQARGLGARERLGILSIAVEADRGSVEYRGRCRTPGTGGHGDVPCGWV